MVTGAPCCDSPAASVEQLTIDECVAGTVQEDRGAVDSSALSVGVSAGRVVAKQRQVVPCWSWIRNQQCADCVDRLRSSESIMQQKIRWRRHLQALLETGSAGTQPAVCTSRWSQDVGLPHCGRILKPGFMAEGLSLLLGQSWSRNVDTSLKHQAGHQDGNSETTIRRHADAWPTTRYAVRSAGTESAAVADSCRGAYR